MNAELDVRVTAGFLESGRALANASHTAAMVAGFGTVAAHHAVTRLVFAGSMLCWLVESWFAVRVMIDAELFRDCPAGDLETDWRQLDELLISWRFLRAPTNRSTADRTRGAMRLWRRQVLTFMVQATLLVAAVLLQFEGF